MMIVDASAIIAIMFEEAEAYVAQFNARADKPPMTIYHDQEYREKDIDAIVMGTRSSGPIDRLLRRSVAAQVARTADVPVMILNPDKSRIRSAEKPFDRFTPILAP